MTKIKPIAVAIAMLCAGDVLARMNDCTEKHRQTYANKTDAYSACNALMAALGRTGECPNSWLTTAYTGCPSGWVSFFNLEWPVPEYQVSGFGMCTNNNNGGPYESKGQTTTFEYCRWDGVCPNGYAPDPATPEDKTCKLPEDHIPAPEPEPEPSPAPQPVTDGVEIGFSGDAAQWVENVDIDTGEGPFVPAVYDPVSDTWKASHVNPEAIYIDGLFHPDETTPDGEHRLIMDVKIQGETVNDATVILRKTEINDAQEIDDIMSLQPSGEVTLKPNPADDGEYDLGIFENTTIKEAYKRMKQRETAELSQ